MSSILNFDFWNEYLGRLKSTFSVVLLLSYSAWLLSPEKWPFAGTTQIAQKQSFWRPFKNRCGWPAPSFEWSPK